MTDNYLSTDFSDARVHMLVRHEDENLIDFQLSYTLSKPEDTSAVSKIHEALHEVLPIRHIKAHRKKLENGGEKRYIQSYFESYKEAELLLRELEQRGIHCDAPPEFLKEVFTVPNEVQLEQPLHMGKIQHPVVEVDTLPKR